MTPACALQLTSAASEDQPFRVPALFPGASAELPKLPRQRDGETTAERREKIAAIYPAVPELHSELADRLRGVSPRVTLAELQQRAGEKHPQLSAAAADVEVARGNAIQAGLGPNPTLGYQADTVNTGDTWGYQGVFGTQTIVTAGKLCLAQQVAEQELAAAELKYRSAAVEVASRVRRHYFAAVMAAARLEFALAQAELFRQSYETQIRLVQIDESSAYEPLQLRVFLIRAANEITRAEADYQSAWRQLAAAVNEPDLPLQLVSTEYDAMLPPLEADAVRAQVLSSHTRIGQAQVQIARERSNIALQDALPTPNIELGGAFFYDDTTPESEVAFNLQVGLPLPLRDNNVGHQIAAAARFRKAQAESQLVTNTLSGQTAEAVLRYNSQRTIVQRYREDLLPAQVKTYRGLLKRFEVNRERGDFVALVQQQQQLAAAVTDYLDTLDAQWQAAVDVAELVQTADFFSWLATAPQPSNEDIRLVP